MRTELRLTRRGFLVRACAALQLNARPAGLAGLCASADCCSALNAANLTALVTSLQAVAMACCASCAHLRICLPTGLTMLN